MQNQKLAEFSAGLVTSSPGKAFLSLLCCAAVPLIISATYMGLYWGLFTVASDYDSAGQNESGAFDKCTLITTTGSGLN